MASSIFPYLVSGPSGINPSKEPTPEPEPAPFNAESSPSKPFPIARLPYELRQLIYTYYHLSRPAVQITCSNTFLPHHLLTPLSLASPFLAFDPSPVLFYKHSKFSLSCPQALKAFSSTNPFSQSAGRQVRKVKILYGRYDQPCRDWVYLLTSCFERLERVSFAVDRERGGVGAGHCCFANWWRCVRDAVREGLCSPGNGKEGLGRGERKVLLRVEDGEWGVEEVLCG
jgi:hypothetical protein